MGVNASWWSWWVLNMGKFIFLNDEQEKEWNEASDSVKKTVLRIIENNIVETKRKIMREMIEKNKNIICINCKEEIPMEEEYSDFFYCSKCDKTFDILNDHYEEVHIY